MQISIILLLLLIHNGVLCQDHLSQDEIDQEIAQQKITYGATIRIKHLASNYYLHSHSVKYGSGSHQQSVTGISENNDYNSLWTIKEGHDEPLKYYEENVRCGDIIRLEHALTNKNLHSHNIAATLSGNPKTEVSCYGDDGNGDQGDNWLIQCDQGDPGIPLKGNAVFSMKNVVTSRWLHLDRANRYDYNNCGHGCPILHQLEVCADPQKSSKTNFKIYSGIFYQTQEHQSDDYEDRDEL